MIAHHRGGLRGTDSIQHVRLFGSIEFPLDKVFFVIVGSGLYILLVSDVRCRTNTLLPVRHQTPGFGYFGTLRVCATKLRRQFSAFAFLLGWGRWDVSHIVHCRTEGTTLATVRSVRSETLRIR
jgi:hypothetical protein